MKSMKETHHDLKFIYGGGGAQLGRKGQPKRRPMQILREYIADQKMRLIDFFFALDKDKSMSITRDEFRTGIRVSFRPTIVTMTTSAVLNNFLQNRLHSIARKKN